MPAPTRHSLSCREHGTRVHVQDLFGNMPVRIKQRALTCDGREQEKLWEKLIQKLIALVLAWGLPVTLVLRNQEGAKKLLIRGKGSSRPISLGTGSGPASFDISLVRSVLSQAGYVEPLDWNTWIETSAVTSFISIHGAISLQPAPSKRVQFISLGIHYVDPGLNKILYDELNQTFASSDFGKEMDSFQFEGGLRRKKGKRSTESEITVKQLKGAGKGADRWPMFFIRIDFLSGPQMRLKGDLDNVREDALLRISSTLRTMIVSFLKDHHFRPHTKRVRLDKKADSVPPQKDWPVVRSQHARSGLRTLTSADLGISSKNHILATAPSGVGRSIHVDDSEQIYVNSPRKDVVSGSAQSQNPSHWSLYSEHGFSTWSRIRSGKREELDKLLSQKTISAWRQAPSKDTDAENDLTSLTSLPYPAEGSALEASKNAGEKDGQNENVVASGFSEAEQILADEAPLQENSVVSNGSGNNQTPEEITQWTNPVTGATVFLSTRTGLEVRRPSMQPVSMQPVSMQPVSMQPVSLPKFEAKTGHTRNAKIGMAKLTPSSSDPFSNLKEGSWVSELLKRWNNPVFKPCEESIPVISFGNLDGASSGQQHGRAHSCSDLSLQKAFTESSSFYAAKLSKDALSRSKLIAQVDRKFLLVCMDLSLAKGGLEEGGLQSARFLVLIDQHAADERIRVEGLLADVCRGPNPEANTVPSAVYPQSAIPTIILPHPITFAIHQREGSLFTADAFHFAQWGILYSLGPRTETEKDKEKDQSKPIRSTGFQITVRALPEAIAERCRVDPKMLIDLLRTEVWKRKDAGLGSKMSADKSPCSPSSSTEMAAVDVDGGQDQPRPDWLRRVGTCPQGMLDMINSRACRSAIMFNDNLTGEECKLLVRKLSKCAFPFQCAHGRPSMVPLVRVGEGEGDGLGIAKGLLGSRDREERRDTEREFGAAWRAWMGERAREGQEKEVVAR